jgi:N-methylhydantoinase A
MHACEVAERLEIPRVLIPRYPGVLCALGLLVADVGRDTSRAILRAITSEDFPELNAQLEEMIASARDDLHAEGIDEARMVFHGIADMRYRGQSYELAVRFDENFVANFHAEHARSYGHSMPNRAVEVVNLRVQAVGLVDKPTFQPEEVHENDGSSALLGQKSAIFRAGEVTVNLYGREKLSPGAKIAGAALIFQLDCTTVLPPGWSARVDAYRNLILDYQL